MINKSDILKYIIYGCCTLLVFSMVRFDLLKPHTKKHLFPTGNHWLAGSILKARQDGLFSTGTFTAAPLPAGGGLFELHYHSCELYYSEQDIPPIPESEWQVYRSALRIPTSFYVMFDMIHFNITKEPKDLIPLYRTIASLLFAMTVFLFLLWIGRQFGGLVVLVSTVILCFCTYLFTSGDRIQPSIWIDFLPLFAGLHLFSNKISWFRVDKKLHLFLYGLLSVILFASDSYEWIPPLMVGLMLPYIYYANLAKENWKIIGKALFTVGVGGLAGFATILFIHFLATAYVEGGMVEGIEFFKAKFLYRTSGTTADIAADPALPNIVGVNEEITEQLSKNGLLDVLKTYFTDKAILFSYTALELLGVLTLSIPFIFFKKQFFPKLYENRDKILRTLLLTTGGLIASLSFFIVFKGHAVFHEFMDYYAFSLSFLPFFIVYISILISTIASDLVSNIFGNKNFVQAILYGIALLPILLPLNKKYSWVTSEKIEFYKRDAVLFDLFEEGNYSFLVKDDVVMEQNIFTSDKNGVSLYLNLDQPKTEREGIVIKLKYNADPHGQMQVFYDRCVEGRFVKKRSTSRRVSYGDNLMYIYIEPEQCAENIRIDLINKPNSSICIEELVIK